MNALPRDPRVDAVLAQLRAKAAEQSETMERYYQEKRLEPARATNPGSARDMAFVRDKLMALEQGKCDLCYLLCRAINARRVVEFGTSFGVSTIYLASAVRDCARNAQPGIVIGTEIEPAKAAAAQANLAQAGLDSFVDLRLGDARDTLRDCGGAVDFLLIDSWVALARPVIEIVAPQLRTGAVIVCDNVHKYQPEYKDYTDFVRDPSRGFGSVLLSHEGGIEVSVKLG